MPRNRNTRFVVVVLLAAALCDAVNVQAHGFARGIGKPDDPFEVATAEDLIAIGTTADYLNKCYVLVADIDLSGITWDQAPIGAFDGRFDGAGFAVSHLTIRGGDRLGLFASLGQSAMIRNLRVVDVNVVGDEPGNFVGALAGRNDGLIEGCTTSGDITGNYCVGGLVGCNEGGGVIRDCTAIGTVLRGESLYSGDVGGMIGQNVGALARCRARASVTGGSGLAGSNEGSISACCATGEAIAYERFGGLVGSNSGAVTSSYAQTDVRSTYWTPFLGVLIGCNSGRVVNCYAVGTALNTAYPEDSLHGGLVGGLPQLSIAGAVVNCFWDEEVSGIPFSMGGMGLKTAQMMDREVFSLNGWGSDPNWVLDAGNDYPRLAWEGTSGKPIPTPAIDWFEGTGTADDPYVITTPVQFARIGTASILWDRVFVMTDDIDLAGVEFPRIGCCLGTDFSGTFDGGGHTIDHLTINTGQTPMVSNIGMFGYVGPYGRVRRLTVRNAAIQCGLGPDAIGILAGRNDGVVCECCVDGAVAGGGYSTNLGGLVGHNAGSLEDCTSAVALCGAEHSDSLGALVGRNSLGQVDRCGTVGTVSGGEGSRCLGGLVGLYHGGSITRSFATALVHGADGASDLGGLVGLVEVGSMADCYATGNVCATAKARYLGGLIGYLYEGSHCNTCYAVGRISANDDSRCLGGLIGYFRGNLSGAQATACFWDVQSTGLSFSDGGMGLTTDQLMDPEFLGRNGWGGNLHWVVDAGKDYPRLVWEGTPGVGIPDTSATAPFPGSGTPDDPYRITTPDELARIGTTAALWNCCFVLGCDLDLEGVAVRSVGVDSGMAFTGIFDGNDHAIRNLAMAPNDLASPVRGLFGYIGRSGQVRRLIVEDAVLAGADQTQGVGILAGVNYGTVTDCRVSGEVTVSYDSGTVGGLVGYNRGTITSCLATANIAAGESCSLLGGLVGDNWGTVVLCHATGSVSAGTNSQSVGGLVGANGQHGQITDSYAETVVFGGARSRGLGGLVGLDWGSKIKRAYARAEVSGGAECTGLGGLLGEVFPFTSREIVSCYFLSPTDGGGPDNGLGVALSDAEMRRRTSFVDWDFETVWTICEGTDHPRLMWEDIECSP